jgi:hypothetical protein
MGKSSEMSGTLIFTAATVIFLLFMLLYSSNIYFSDTLSILADSLSIMYLVFAILFSLFRDRKSTLRYYIAIFIAQVVVVIISFYYMMSIPLFVTSVLDETFGLGIMLAVSFPTLVISVFGFYLIRSNVIKNYSKQIGTVLLIIAIIFFFYYQIYGFGYKGVGANDETVIAYYAYNAIESGHNPYTINVKNVLENNATTYGFTLRTDNHIVGYLDYPVLFVAIMAPFYYIYHGTAGYIISSGNSLAYLIFLVTSLLVFAALVNRDRLKNFGLILPPMLIFILYFAQMLSVQYLFMVIVLMLIFYSIDKWYAFLFIGIAVSIQELLWIPALLALVYIASTRGIVKGVKNIVGTALIFILINAYFILQSPMLFVRDVFAPVNGMLLPLLLSPGPSLLAMFYPISMHGFEYIFYISIVISIIGVYFARNKLLIASMSLFSYLMLYHAMVAYFAMPAVLMFVIIVMEKPVYGNIGTIKTIKRHRKNNVKDLRNRNALIAISGAIIVLFLLIIYFHASYINNFGIHVSYNGTARNETYAVLRISDESIYTRNVSILEIYSTNAIEENTGGLSVSNTRYITNASYCNQLCMNENYINYNILHLKSKSTNKVLLFIPNGTETLRCIIYTSRYYYECPALTLQ